MKLLHSLTFFQAIIFVTCFSLSNALDCGGNQVKNTITVDQQQGNGNFVTVQAAIDSIQTNNNQWVKVHINPGIYKERVKIPKDKPCVILEGSDSTNTIITFDSHSMPPEDWMATFTSSPSNVILRQITFENSFNLINIEHIKPALAAAIFGDKTAIFNCRFVGVQDTLFPAIGRHYIKDSYIQGEVDFIFGSGQSYFENCVMNATLPKDKPIGFVTAHRRESPNEPNGFVFYQGSVVGNAQINLGRPWGPYSRVIFLGTYFTQVVTPQGWEPLNYDINLLTYAEINCGGEGADTKGRVPWVKTSMSDSDLNQFSLASFINNDGWLYNIPSISF